VLCPKLEELRVRQDDVGRDLDLEGGSTVIKAKLGTLEAIWTAEDELERVGYQATFYETRESVGEIRLGKKHHSLG
jgi:hypothetical protein